MVKEEFIYVLYRSIPKITIWCIDDRMPKDWHLDGWCIPDDPHDEIVEFDGNEATRAEMRQFLETHFSELLSQGKIISYMISDDEIPHPSKDNE